MQASRGRERFKWGFVSICGVGALCLAYTAGRAGAPSPGADAAKLPASPTDPAHADEGTKALRELDPERLARLEATVRMLSYRAQRAHDKPAVASAARPDESDRPTLSPQEQLALGEVRRATTVAVMKQRLVDESKDVAWAPRFEAGILRGARDKFPKLNVTNVTCKTTLCELKVTAETQAEIDQFLLDFPPAFPLADEAHYEPLTLDDGTFGVELRIVRKGSGEEFDQEVTANAALTFQRMTM